MNIAKGFNPNQINGELIFYDILLNFSFFLGKISKNNVIRMRVAPVMPAVKKAKLIDHICLFKGINQIRGKPINADKTEAIDHIFKILFV